VAQANKVQFNPVSVGSVEQVAKLEKQFQQLLKVHGELNRRVKNTGQSGKGFMGMDYDQIFPDANVRNRQMQKIMAYTLGPGAFTGGGGGGAGPGPGIQPHPGRGGGGGGGGPGMGTRVAQAGLSALGPAGGVASGALGTGMSAGFGAGLMGLLGGMLALGVGKLVSGVMEKVGQAENNNVALDKLKRTLGDVNVSFEGLKAVVNGSANSLRITYAEAGKLATQFARMGNMKSGQYTSLGDEVGVGVGLSRAFGLDNSEGVGVMGQLRGVGVTKDTQGSKRFALLIGETIAKSDAFAKADEVIGAIGSYATNQTRNNLGVANTMGYAGAFSSLVGSGIPGLDPSGAGALLSRINSSLSAGGAKGEASQFFTGMLGARRGMDVYDTQLWREGGAFSTADSTFSGKGSNYGAVSQFYDKYGLKKPSGDETLLGATMGQLQQQYSKDPKGMLNATANQMGISMSQAAALHLVDPKRMGELEGYAGDLTKLNAGGIANVTKAVTGTDDDRRAIADSMLSRKDVSADDKDAIKKAMNEGTEQQKLTLARITAQYDQEQTTGKIALESKNALDNIATNMADKLVPYMNEARLGIMHLAGFDKGKSSDQIMLDVIGANSDARKKAIEGQFKSAANPLVDQKSELERKLYSLDPEKLRRTYDGKPDVLAAKLKERADVQKEITEIELKLKKLEEEKNELLTKENAAKTREIDEQNRQSSKRMMDEVSGGDDPNQSASSNSRRAHARLSGGGGMGTRPLTVDTSAIDPTLAAAEKANGLPPGMMRSVVQQEVGGNAAAYINDPAKYHYEPDANGRRKSSAFGPFGILESTAKNPGYGVSPLKDKSLAEQTRFASEYLSARSRSAGSFAGGLAGYGEGAGYANSVLSRVPKVGTPVPDAGTATGTAAGGGSVTQEGSMEVVLRYPDGNQAGPPQTVKTRVRSNWQSNGPK